MGMQTAQFPPAPTGIPPAASLPIHDPGRHLSPPNSTATHKKAPPTKEPTGPNQNEQPKRLNASQSLNQLLNRTSRVLQLLGLVVGQVDLDDLLDAFGTDLHRYADEQAV